MSQLFRQMNVPLLKLDASTRKSGGQRTRTRFANIIGDFGRNVPLKVPLPELITKPPRIAALERGETNMKDIKNYIPLGKDNAISCRKLAEKMGCSERDVQAAVLQARAEGYPICSTPNNGYFMPMSVDEALAYYGL